MRQVPLGSSVYLDCRVKELQDYQVSAEERPIGISMSLQILTFGKNKWMRMEWGANETGKMDREKVHTSKMSYKVGE